jgi:hypothetical protein
LGLQGPHMPTPTKVMKDRFQGKKSVPLPKGYTRRLFEISDA